jgi:hypothetical protein
MVVCTLPFTVPVSKDTAQRIDRIYTDDMYSVFYSPTVFDSVLIFLIPYFFLFFFREGYGRYNNQHH